MKHLLYLMLIILVFACNSSAQKTMQPADTGKKEMMQDVEKRAMEPMGVSQTALLERYYVVSKMEAEAIGFIPDMQEMFVDAVTESAETLGEDKVALLNETFVKTVTPESVFESFKTHFSKNFNAVHLTKTIAWLESPVGKRITAMEDYATSSEGEEAMMAYTQTLKENPPDSIRLAKIFKLFEDKGVKQMAVDLVIGMIGSSERIVNKSLPKEDRKTSAELKENVENLSQLMALPTEMGIAMLAAFMYKDASDADLETMLAFYNSEAGDWYSKTEVNAMLGMVEESFSNVYRALYANK